MPLQLLDLVIHTIKNEIESISMSSQSSQIDLLNWKISEYDPLHSVGEVIRKTNWVNLCQRASDLNHGLPCMPLSKMTNGLHNLVCILQFSDQTRWVARIGLHSSAADSAKLRNEVDAMHLIKENCTFQVPRVFAYEIDDKNSVGVPFILMEFLPGNTAMDAAGGYDVHGGHIPFAYRQIFYRSVAECHVSKFLSFNHSKPNLNTGTNNCITFLKDRNHCSEWRR